MQTIDQAVCKELVDPSSQGDVFCITSMLLILSFQRNSKLQPVEEADFDSARVNLDLIFSFANVHEKRISNILLLPG